MKVALVLCIAALGSQHFQACCHHHHHHHQAENQQYAIAHVYAPHENCGHHSTHHEHCGSLQCTHHEHCKGHHSTHHEHCKCHHCTHHEQCGGHHSHHFKDNLGASIHTTYSGIAFEPNQCGQPECMGSYSGSNVFVQPATGSYDRFAVKCKSILQSLLEFISRPVEFGCAPGSSLNLDLRSRIVNHKLPCETICVTEGAVVPVLEEKIMEIPISVSTPDCATEVCPQVTSECGSCNTSPVKVIPVEVTPVREPVHRVHIEPAIVPTHHYHDVVYEQPIVETEIITPQVCEEEDPKEMKHHIHHLQKQYHHMLHNQKKHGHHHHH